MDVLAGVLLVSGSVFMFLAGFGMLRFRETFERMHAASKASSLGIILIGVGAALRLDTRSVLAIALVVVLHLLTVPVGAHLIGRSAHREWSAQQGSDVVDELAAATESPDGPADAVQPADPSERTTEG